MQLPEHDFYRPKYSITTVVEIIGVPAQQLRRWESSGMLTPERSLKGTRRYSDADLEQIRKIITLVASGVNTAGVEHILRLQQALAHAEAHVQALENPIVLPTE